VRWILQKLITCGIFLTVLLSFLANPAPVSIEFADLVLIALSLGLGVLSLASVNHYDATPIEKKLLFAVFLYFSYLLFSGLLGLLQGVPILNMMRSLGPYISFFPLLFLGLLPARIVRINKIALILIAVGLFQIIYLSYLYFTHAEMISNTASVLRNRITLMDPRTTLPFLLAVTLLPSIFLFEKNIARIFAICCILLGILAGMMTLTRAILLSMLMGWFVLVGLYVYFQSQLQRFSLSLFLRKISVGLLCAIILFFMLSLIPKVHLIESGLLARFFDSAASGHVDYSDGRIYDEWLPALMRWGQSGWLSIFFGIGAGNTFNVLSGEERTYIHNLTIYSLVYGGIFGLFSCLWLYFTIFKTLIARAFQSKQFIYLAYAGLLASLFFYGQLFAVHKGLAYNVMLFLIIGVALIQPTKTLPGR